MTPIDEAHACSLNRAALSDRRGEIARLFSDALLAIRLDASGLRLSLEPRPEVEAAARDLLAREARCCPFFATELHVENDVLDVRVSAPGGGRETLAGLYGLAREALAVRSR